MTSSPAAITKFVNRKFPDFGINKRREIIRLLYEIAKRENTSYRRILSRAGGHKTFSQIKTALLARRYPSLSDAERRQNAGLPELLYKPGDRQIIKPKFLFKPSTIYVERAVREFPLVDRFRSAFPKARLVFISSYSEFVANKSFSMAQYNQRAKNLFLIEEKFHFLSPCPCTNGAEGCGYVIANLGFGCPFECAYCFLQGYANAPGIVLPVNIADFLKQLEKTHRPLRIGSGQFTDSLIFERQTSYAAQIIDFLRRHPQITFEFKTKSALVEPLLSLSPPRNVVIAWSVNPERMIRENEFYTASLADRLKAAAQCVRAGYGVAFHFDPIIAYPGWEEKYHQVVDRIFDLIPAKSIRWISLGTLRMPPKLKTVIERRFPRNTILDGEQIKGYDDKLRYPERQRLAIYSSMLKKLQTHTRQSTIYLCMEPRSLAQRIGLPPIRFDFNL